MFSSEFSIFSPNEELKSFLQKDLLNRGILEKNSSKKIFFS